MQKLLYLFIGLAISLLLISLVLSSMKKPETRKDADTKEKTSQETIEPTGETVEIQIVGNEYSFSPSSFEINAGDKIILTFRNVGKMPHNLVIDELDVATKNVPRGQSDTVEFTTTQSGSLRYYCSISNHAALGMVGSLEVK